MAEDSASWYARKLGQMRTPQGYARPVVPQYQPPVPSYQQNTSQISPDAGELHAIQQPASPETLTEMLDMQNHGQGLKPGKGARLNPDPCPGCGGNLYYADLGQKRRGPPPAPRCFTCGYNELFEQGLEANWQSGA